MDTGALGKVYQDGETVFRQGDVGDCMYVIQEGKVEVLVEDGDQEIQVAIRSTGDFIGEMAIFERDVRSATIRAMGQVRLLTIDKKNFMRRIAQDPSLAFRVVETMSRRIRDLNEKYAHLKAVNNDQSK